MTVILVTGAKEQLVSLKVLFWGFFSLIFFINDIFLFVDSSNVFNYADHNTFAFGKTFGEITRKLQNDFFILDEWFLNNFLVLNSGKCHFKTLWTPNALHNFKCNNITIKNNASEKLLGVIIDNRLDFTEHLNTVCEKVNLKLHALNRISRLLNLEQHVLIINAYMKIFFQLLSQILDDLLQNDYVKNE